MVLTRMLQTDAPGARSRSTALFVYHTPTSRSWRSRPWGLLWSIHINGPNRCGSISFNQKEPPHRTDVAALDLTKTFDTTDLNALVKNKLLDNTLLWRETSKYWVTLEYHNFWVYHQHELCTKTKNMTIISTSIGPLICHYQIKCQHFMCFISCTQEVWNR